MESQGKMDPPHCANNCGFYGSVYNRNLCSKCYNDVLKKEIAKSTAKLECTDKLMTPIAPLHSPTANQSLIPETAVPKCKCCKKRIRHIGFECRCGDVFCGRHRYPEEHACKFDFKDVEREVLVKQNPVCRGDKLQWRI